ncbi:MAG TPA: hypothetical protein VMV94_12725 [Phycisphaerae bacterium]|nr:hypothetical protein [Phycisphaerae bacterium]
MPRSAERSKLLVFWRSRMWKPVILTLAALPLFQVTGCFPDILGALNFELQALVNTTVLTAANTIIQNVLRL